MKISNSARWFSSGEGAVVMNLDTGRYVGLNKTATSIWVDLSSGASLAAIEDRVLGEYDTSRTQIRSDLEEFLSQLRQYQLVRD